LEHPCAAREIPDDVSKKRMSRGTPHQRIGNEGNSHWTEEVRMFERLLAEEAAVRYVRDIINQWAESFHVQISVYTAILIQNEIPEESHVNNNEQTLNICVIYHKGMSCIFFHFSSSMSRLYKTLRPIRNLEIPMIDIRD
jgi:hypothetical protein